MKTVLRIVEQAGGYRRNLYLRVENPPYMALVIEAMPELGPCGQSALSVAHYGEQNGDLMRDPEMRFEWTKPLGLKPQLSPFYFRNDYIGVEQYSRKNNGEQYVFLPELYRKHRSFAAPWDENLHLQGFLEALARQPKPN